MFSGSVQRNVTRINLIAASVAIAFVTLCVVGIVRMYSPVPVGDDWGVYLGFNLDILEGKTSAWWDLDDAHRLIFPRLLYWLDFHYFGRRFVFLIVVNLIVRVGILVTLIAYARNQIKQVSLFVIYALFSALAFAWMQAPNFYHGIDGPLAFLGMLFSLLGFYWLHRAKENPFWFLPALLIGLASMGTMADGVLVLPIMTVMSVCIGLGARRISILAIVCLISLGLYFWDFKVIATHMYADPIALTLFIFAYLGNPFFYVVAYWLAGLQHLSAFIFGNGSFLVIETFQNYASARMAGTGVAIFAGGILVAAVIQIAWRWVRHERIDSCQGALLAFIGFIFACATLTAIGRATYGFDYAVQERYTTESLLAWQAFAIILLARTEAKKVARILTILVIVIPIALLPSELRAVLKSDQAEQLQRLDSLRILKSGNSDDEAVARIARRLKQMGIELAP
jgi:hypothetical protein